jgi:hypothetical protein
MACDVGRSSSTAENVAGTPIGETAHIRARYADIMREKRSALQKTCALAGADLLNIGTAEPLIPTLMRYLTLRKKRRYLPAARGSAL